MSLSNDLLHELYRKTSQINIYVLSASFFLGNDFERVPVVDLGGLASEFELTGILIVIIFPLRLAFFFVELRLLGGGGSM